MISIQGKAVEQICYTKGAFAAKMQDGSVEMLTGVEIAALCKLN
jgi:hypothetical protein